MARIRTIKPEFWTDEKVTACSMPARLFFIGLWTFADDDGRMPFSPKRLQLQIFPGDPVDVEELVAELVSFGLIRVYAVEGRDYLAVCNFNRHQRMSHPSPSRVPEFPENSGTFRKTLDGSGSGNGNGNGSGKNQNLLSELKNSSDETVCESAFSEEVSNPTPKAKPAREGKSLRPHHPTVEEVGEYCRERENQIDPQRFVDHYQANGWKVGRNAMKDWRAAVRTWEKNEVNANGREHKSKAQQRYERQLAAIRSD